MFAIKIRGDDEVTAAFELGKGLVEDASPNFWGVPIVLMAQKGDVGVSLEFDDVVEFVATMVEEAGAEIIAEILPTLAGGLNLGRANVESLEVCGGGFFNEDAGEDGGFIGPAAGEVEQVEMFLLFEKGGQVGAKVFFEFREVLCGVFVVELGDFKHDGKS